MPAATRILRLIRRAFVSIESALEALSALIMTLIALLVCGDVVLRYVFSAPTVWTYDLIGKYLIVALFFGMLSVTQARHGHISVDIFQYSMTRSQRHVCEAVACVVTLPIMALLAWIMAHHAWENFERGDVLSGVIAWPTWPPYAIVAFGSAFFVCRLAFSAFAHVRAATGGPGVSLPMLPGEVADVEEPRP